MIKVSQIYAGEVKYIPIRYIIRYIIKNISRDKRSSLLRTSPSSEEDEENNVLTLTPDLISTKE